jgi:outer membrane assembly lipoprotein YfiO
MKLEIANAFANGEIKNLIGLPGIPLWVDAKGEALKLYEEISSALPTHLLAEKAILAKSNLEFDLKEFRQAISTSESFLRKYAQSTFAPLAFEKIGVSYLKLVEAEYLDPDLLSLAEMNYRKFEEQFPNHPKLIDIQNNLVVMKEHFAKNMLTTGLYFKKTKKIEASRFYFEKIIQTYPETNAAKEAESVLKTLPKA